MKVAFLFSGQLRDLPYSLFRKSLFNLTEGLDYSIFSYCWDKKGKSLNHKSINPESHPVKNIDEYINFIFQDFNLSKYGYESFESFKNKMPVSHNKIFNSKKYHFGTINSLPQIYNIQKCYKLLEENNEYFDLVFRCRFDSLFIHPLTLFPLDKILSSDNLFNINFGRAYYPQRIYDIFFGGSLKSMSFLSQIWSNVPKLVNDKFNNGLDQRDSCRILFLGATQSKVNIKSFDSRICDVYRNNGFEYEKYLVSSHIVKVNMKLRTIKYLKFILSWLRIRDIKVIYVLISFLKYICFLPFSYLKRIKFIIKNYLNFF